MTTAAKLRSLLDRFVAEGNLEVEAERQLVALPDEQFKIVIQAAATLFVQLRQEAIRRGLWDELTHTLKVKPVKP